MLFSSFKIMFFSLFLILAPWSLAKRGHDECEYASHATGAYDALESSNPCTHLVSSGIAPEACVGGKAGSKKKSQKRVKGVRN